MVNLWRNHRASVRARRELISFLPASAIVEKVRPRPTICLELLFIVLGIVTVTTVYSSGGQGKFLTMDGFNGLAAGDVLTAVFYYMPVLLWMLVFGYSVVSLLAYATRLLTIRSASEIARAVDVTSLAVIVLSVIGFVVASSGVIATEVPLVSLSIVIIVLWLLAVYGPSLLALILFSRLVHPHIIRGDMKATDQAYSKLAFIFAASEQLRVLQHLLAAELSDPKAAQHILRKAAADFQWHSPASVYSMLDGIGEFMWMQSEYTKSAAFLSAACRSDPTKVFAYKRLIICYAGADGSPQRAQELLDFARYHTTDFEHRMFAEVYVMAMNQHFDDARHLLNTVAAGCELEDFKTADSNTPEQRSYLKLAFNSLDDKTRDWLKTMMEMAAGKSIFCFARAYVEQRAGNEEAAYAFYMRGYHADPNGSDGRVCLARAEALKDGPASLV